MALTHQLTVGGRTYFLPDPVTHIKSQILEAVIAGGNYVHIPPLHGGSGLDVLFSPGTPVVWSSSDIPDGDDVDGDSFLDFAKFADID